MGVEPQTARRRPQHLRNLGIGVSPIARAIKGQEPVEFFHNVNIDFLGKKWYFLAFSLIFSVAGVLSMLFWHHVPWGLDFRGGTIVQVKFAHKPDIPAVHTALDRAGLHHPKIQPYDLAVYNKVLIDLDVRETSEQALDQGKQKIIQALETNVPAG